MPINLSQYRWSVGIFNNRNFSVQSKVSHFIYLSDNNNNNNNNNNNTEIGCLILLNKIGLVLLLLTLMFAFKGNNSKYKKIIFVWVLSPIVVSFNLLHRLFILHPLKGDAELNPGPKRNAAETLSICHWNLNSICALQFAKLHPLRAYVSVHKFNIISLSKTYLDSSIDDDII